MVEDFTDIIKSGFNMLYKNKSLWSTFNCMLEKILHKTDSKFGIIGKVEYDDNIPIIVPYGITDIAWTEGLSKNIKNMKFRLQHDNLLLAPIKFNKTILTNNPEKHPMYNGVPHGHVKLTSYLATPIKSRNKIIGYLGIANKQNGYEENIIEPFENIADMLSVIMSLYTDKLYDDDMDIDNKIINNILDISRDGIILLNKYNKILIANSIIDNMMDTNDFIGDSILDYFPTLTDYFYSPNPHYSTMIIKNMKDNDVKLKIKINKVNDSYYVVYIINLTKDNVLTKKILEHKDKYIKILNHELRNPLQSMMLSSFMLQKQYDNKKYDKMENLIKNLYVSTRAMKKVFDDMQEIYNFDKTIVKIKLSCINYILFINDIVEYNSRIAFVKNNQIKSKISTDIKKYEIITDEVKLSQIINGIIALCNKKTNNGIIQIISHVAHNKLTINIKDNSIGFSKEHLDKLLNSDYSNEIEGLSDTIEHESLSSVNTSITISLKYIKIMNGNIQFNSVKNKGNNILIEIPIKHNKPNEESLSMTLKDIDINILIIDDNKDNCKLLCKTFNYIVEKYNVKINTTCLYNGYDILNNINNINYNLIFADINMYPINGIELAKKLRDNNFSKPIIALTGDIFVEHKIPIDEKLFNDIIIKPCGISTIINLLNKYHGKIDKE